jgi:hypothetical protein
MYAKCVAAHIAYLGQSAVMRSKVRKAAPAVEPDGSCSA